MTPSYQQTSPNRKLIGVPLLLGLLAFGTVVVLGLVLWPRGQTERFDRDSTPAPQKPVVEALPPPVALPDLAIVVPPPPPPEVVKQPPPRKLISKPITTVSKPVKEVLAPEQVDRKFQQVKAEYLEFKRNFGARLEEHWQQILSEIALGRRDQRVSDALDLLRKEMKSVRETSAQQK